VPEEELALYYTPICGYCLRVLRVIERLGLEVELRNTIQDPKHWDALFAARGRATVPVLWIHRPGEEPRWMPESADIIDYLERHYAG
jgi:glutathione S-transferase